MHTCGLDGDFIDISLLLMQLILQMELLQPETLKLQLQMFLLMLIWLKQERFWVLEFILLVQVLDIGATMLKV